MIDQTQFLGSENVPITATTHNHSIRFNHPVQEIIWALRRADRTADNDWFNFSGNLTTAGALPVQLPTDPFYSASILINNQERVLTKPAMYFRTVQPYQSHNRIPASDRYVYTYCFGMKPEELLETGSVNMSRLDNAVLRINYNAAVSSTIIPPVTGNLFVYARNKNIIKVTVGMSGLKFAA